MQISKMNWRQVEDFLKSDDRCVLPLGSTEQHAQLSLCVDMILAERVAVEAAEPLGTPVYPVMPYGIAPYFDAFPGSVSLRIETLTAVYRDLIASVKRSGFRRVLIVNGHGGNAPVGNLAVELMSEHPDLSIKFHNWWNAPETFAAAKAIDPTGSHGNWLENFPWTRLEHAPSPTEPKPPVDYVLLRASNPQVARTMLGDGSFGGPYIKPDDVMLEIWSEGVQETREALEGPWPTQF
jgi:creatinine amidohydrolase